MKFLLSLSKNESFNNSCDFSNYLCNYSYNHKIRARDFIFESSGKVILGEANLAFKNCVQNNHISGELIENNLDKLTNGYVIVYDKNLKQIKIYTDTFGFYHLYYLKEKGEIIVSSDFKELLNYSSKSVDDFAILDLIFFNYTLLNRTLLKDVKLVEGGSVITIDAENLDQYEINTEHNFVKNFEKKQESYKVDEKKFSKLLKSSLNEDLSRTERINQTMTGGFDSRVLLALFNNLGLDISTFTFGKEGNIEQKTIESFIDEYTEDHRQFLLDEDYVGSLKEIVGDYIKSNLANPTIFDLPHYEYIRQNLSPSNIITGFMAGEIMQGQSVGAQVTFTRLAKELLACKDKSKLKVRLLEFAKDLNFFDYSYFKEISDEYIESILTYSYTTDKTNTLSFLINEKHSKFFGAINHVFKYHSNLVVPFMEPNLLDYILNSNISFLEKKPFEQSPFSNYKSKVFYAKLIRLLDPMLQDTKLDRLYRVKDLCKYHLLPKAIWGYIKSHVFKLNKRKSLKTLNYERWYKNLFDQNSDFQNMFKISKVFARNFTLKQDNYTTLSELEKKKVATLFGIKSSIERINEISDNFE